MNHNLVIVMLGAFVTAIVSLCTATFCNFRRHRKVEAVAVYIMVISFAIFGGLAMYAAFHQ